MKTTSSIATSIENTASFTIRLFRAYRAYVKANYFMKDISADVEEYRRLLFDYIGKDLSECTAVEIGFGARPLRAAAMASRGANLYAVDLERPLISWSLSDILNIAKENGTQRAIKSVFRKFCFEHGERCAFESEFKSKYITEIRKVNIIISDAASPTFWSSLPSNVDVLYSEDVFEHIPEISLHNICKYINMYVNSNAVLLFRPNMFSGITGAHRPEWYHLNVGAEFHATPPWDHLVTGRHEESVYLNKFAYKDYFKLFSEYFMIEKVINTDFGLGERWLTPEVRSRIPHKWSDSDLLTNNVLFVMRNSKT